MTNTIINKLFVSVVLRLKDGNIECAKVVELVDRLEIVWKEISKKHFDITEII